MAGEVFDTLVSLEVDPWKIDLLPSRYIPYKLPLPSVPCEDRPIVDLLEAAEQDMKITIFNSS